MCIFFLMYSLSVFEVPIRLVNMMVTRMDVKQTANSLNRQLCPMVCTQPVTITLAIAIDIHGATNCIR